MPLIAILLVGCLAGEKPASETNTSSPEATVRSYWDAVAAQDWRTIYACHAPAEREYWLHYVVVWSIAMPKEGERVKRYEALLRRYHLEKVFERKVESQEELKSLLAAVEDKAGLYAELEQYTAEHPASEEAELVKMRLDKITEVKADDTTAVVRFTLKQDQKQRFGAAAMVKVDGKWYFDSQASRKLHFPAARKKRSE